MRAAAVFFLCIVFCLPDIAAAGPADKADKLYSSAKYAEALPLYQALLSSQNAGLPPGYIHSRIGDCYFRQADYRKAASAYRTALKSQDASRRPATQYWIGFCALLLGRNEEATAEFLKIPEQYPASGMWVSTAYYWAGKANERMGNRKQAVAYYRKAGGRGKTSQERYAIKKAEAVK